MQTPINDVRLMLEAGCVYRYARRFGEAREIFHGVRALLPTREVADLALAGICLDEGKLEEAEAYCRRALELNRASAAAYVQLAEIQILQNNSAAARLNIQRSLDISHNGPSAVWAKTLLKLRSKVAANS